MPVALALAALLRHRARTVLAVLGVAVAAAMLLDMVMLSTGMRESLRALIDVRGYQLRVTPRGTLPFDTEATIANASDVRRRIAALPDVAAVAPVLGAALHVTTAAGVMPAVGLGSDPAVQADYELLSGRDALTPVAMVVNDVFLRRSGARLGDTLLVATGYDPQLRTFTGRRRAVVTGRARFLYLAADQAAAALPLATLQAMAGPDRRDAVSLFMVRARDGADPALVRDRIAHTVPRVTAITTADALAEVDQRLGYFRQLAFILGTVSLLVGFLLVATLVTVSVNERLGEFAVQRAIGVSRGHVVQQVTIESVLVSVAGALGGLGLGVVTARWLNGILRAFPGLPAEIDFFLFRPRAAFIALSLLTLSGVIAGLYPAWRASSLPIARTLRQEAVA